MSKDNEVIRFHSGIRAHSDLASSTGVLTSLWIEIPPYCHLYCTYCFANAGNKVKKIIDDKLELADYERLITEFAAGGGQYLGIPGLGEPFHPKNEELVRGIITIADKCKLETTIFTTGETLFYSKGSEEDSEYIKRENDALIDFIFSKNVVLMIKCNSLKDRVQDELVGYKGYAAKRNKALEELIRRGLNSRKTLLGNRRLGIVTSIMDDNIKDIGMLWQYADDNDLIFDCDTILPRGRGIAFYRDSHSTEKQYREAIDRVHECAGLHANPGGTYIGVACDRVKNHLYVDMRGDVYPCIGAWGKMKPFGNIKDPNTSISNIWSHNPARKALRDKRFLVFKNVCNKCENFQTETCYSCLGRAVPEDGIEYDKLTEKIEVSTQGCFNHRPVLNLWINEVGDFLRDALSHEDIKKCFYENFENLWRNNQNRTYLFSHLSQKARNKVIESIRATGGWESALQEIKAKLEEEAGKDQNYKKLERDMSSFTQLKDFDYANLTFSANKVWNFVFLPQSDRATFLKSIIPDILPDVIIPSMKMLFREIRQDKKLFFNFMFYDNANARYFYRTFSWEYDVKRLLVQRWAENFKDDNLISEGGLLNLSGELRKNIYTEYELLLNEQAETDSDAKSRKFSINVQHFLEMEVVRERAEQIADKINDIPRDRLHGEIETALKKIFRENPDDNGILELRRIYKDLNTCFLGEGLTEGEKAGYRHELDAARASFYELNADSGAIRERIQELCNGDEWHKLINYFIWLRYVRDQFSVSHYWVIHSPKLSRLAEGVKNVESSGLIVWSSQPLLEKNKANIRLLFNNITLPFNELYALKAQSDLSSEIIKHASRSAVSAIMSRNTSHNIGSHALWHMVTLPPAVSGPESERLITQLKASLAAGKAGLAEELIKVIQSLPESDAQNKKFLNYLRERMSFVAMMSVGGGSWSVVRNFNDIITEFEGQELLLRNIAKTEINDLIKSKPEGGAAGDVWAFKLVEPESSLDIEVPHGVLGFHAFFNILENIVRNTYKHDFPAIQALGRGPSFTITIEPLADKWKNDLYRVTITDNLSAATQKRVDDLNSKLAEDFIDASGNLNNHFLGMKEMKSGAAFLRMIPSVGVAGEVPGVPILKIGRDARNNLQHVIYVRKPKTLLAVCGEADKAALGAGADKLEGMGIFCLTPAELQSGIAARDSRSSHQMMVYDAPFKEIVAKISPRLPFRQVPAAGGDMLRLKEDPSAEVTRLWEKWLEIRFGAARVASNGIALKWADCSEFIAASGWFEKDQGGMILKHDGVVDPGSDEWREADYIDAFSSGDPMGGLLASVLSEHDRSLFLQLKESCLAKILVLDERIWFVSPKQVRPEKYAAPVSLKELWGKRRVYLQDHSLFIEHPDEFISQFSALAPDVLIVHQGLIEKAIDFIAAKEGGDKTAAAEKFKVFWDENILPKVARVVIDSDCGRPEKLAERHGFYLNFSELNRVLVEEAENSNFGKYLLVNMISALRED